MHALHLRSYLRARLICPVIVPMLLLGSIHAQLPHESEDQKLQVALPSSKPLLPELARIVDASRQAPPEFHAYALLLLVESGRISDKPTALALLQEAQEVAQQATVPISKDLALGALTIDSELGSWMFRRRFAMDRTSLQARAVTDAQSLDPSMVPILLEALHWPAAEPAACSGALKDDPEALFNLLALLARQYDSASKEGKQATQQLFESTFANLKTHHQMELALRLLSRKEVTGELRENFTQRWIGQLEQQQDDPRGFSALMLDREYGVWLQSLKQMLERQDASAARTTLQSFRGYLVENLKAGGCGADWLRLKNAQSEPLLPRGVVAFNEQLKTELQQAGLEPIAIGETLSPAPVEKAQYKVYGASPEARALMNESKTLRFVSGNERRTLEDLDSTAWMQKAISFLGRVDDWQVDPFNSSDVFWSKMSFYSSLIDLSPKPDFRRMVVEKAVTQLENSRLEAEDPMLLMVFVFQLHVRSASQANGDKFQPRNTNEFAHRLATSRSPALRLLGLLEEAKFKSIPDTL